MLARPQKIRCICSKPRNCVFVPENSEDTDIETIVIGYDEYETVRLIDYVMLTQEQCAEKMQISRTTVTRMYTSARQKIADSLINGKRLRIDGGDVIVCEKMKPECADEKYCCHKLGRSIV